MNPKEIHNAHCSIAQRPTAEGVSAQDKAPLPRAISRQRPRVKDFPHSPTESRDSLSLLPRQWVGQQPFSLEKGAPGTSSYTPKGLEGKPSSFKHVWYQEASTGGCLRQMMPLHQLHFLTTKKTNSFSFPHPKPVAWQSNSLLGYL